MTFPAGQQPSQQNSDQQGQQGSGQQAPGPVTSAGNEQAPQQGQQPPAQPGQPPAPSLLDTVAQQAAQQFQPGAGQQGLGQQQGQPSVPGVDDLVTQVVGRLEAQFNSIADRRVNALLNEIRGQQSQGQQVLQQGQQQPGQQGQGDWRDQQGRYAAAPDPAITREARMAFREYVGGRMQFVSAVEREMVMEWGGSVVQTRVTPGSDADAVGRDVAIAVAQRATDLRRHYEEQVMAALRARGVDVTGGGRGAGSPPQGLATPQDTTERARQAAKTLAEGVNVERGWAQQQPATQ